MEEIINEKKYRSSVEKQMSRALFKDSKLFREQMRVSNMIQQKHAPIKVNLQKKVDRASSIGSSGELEYVNQGVRSTSMGKTTKLDSFIPNKQAQVPRNKDDSAALMVAQLNFNGDGWSESGGDFGGNDSVDMDLNLSIDNQL